MKSLKEYKGLYCLKPFTDIHITSLHMTMCCCEFWLPDFNAGDIEKYSLKEIWNSQKLQSLRQSILDGTYSFCSKESCPYLKSENFKIYKRDELEAVLYAEDNGSELDLSLWHIRHLAPWIRRILDGKVIMDILPANYNLCYDETCNLKCPSCRAENIVHTHGEEYERRVKIHKNIFDDIEKYGFENVRGFFVTGAGDPFASSIYKDFLFNFDGSSNPLLRFYIMTNGVLLTPEVWDKMSKIHENIDYIQISIDAATPETYEKIRVNGNFEKLLRNLEFLGQKRKEKKLNYLSLVFVVQRKNYREMTDFITIAKRYNVDQVLFNALEDWESWELIEEYYENAVCKPQHEEYPELLEILKNPVFDDSIVNLGNITNLRNSFNTEETI